MILEIMSETARLSANNFLSSIVIYICVCGCQMMVMLNVP